MRLLSISFLALAAGLFSRAYAVDQAVTPIALAGVADVTIAANVGGNSFINTGYEFAEVINGSGASITVTVDAYPAGGQGSPDGLAVTDPTVTVAAGTRRKIGPFRKRIYNNATEKVTLTFSATATVTVGVYSFAGNP